MESVHAIAYKHVTSSIEKGAEFGFQVMNAVNAAVQGLSIAQCRGAILWTNRLETKTSLEIQKLIVREAMDFEKLLQSLTCVFSFEAGSWP